MSSFEECLENLPPELYDHIYNLVFTPDPASYHVSSSYTPPAILQVDQGTRRLATNRYYHPDAVFWCTNHENCVRWLTSLSEQTLELLNEVRCEPLSDFWVLDSANYFTKSQRTRVHCQLLQRGIVVRPSLLKFKVWVGGQEEGQEWSAKA